MTWNDLPAVAVEIGGEGAVLAERRGHVMLVTINRPEARNAVDTRVWVGVGEALEAAERDVDVRVVVLTGAGDVSFCAGADLKAVGRGEFPPTDERLRRWGFGGFVRHHISKPVIAAVNGFALGGGTEFVLAADLAVAVDSAQFGLPEVKRGIYAGAGGAFRLGQQIPPKIANQIMLTGEPISARRALELGLINHVSAPGALLDDAFDLAARIAANAPLSVQATKRIAAGITDGDVDTDAAHWRRNDDEGVRLTASADSTEGVRAFAERREPVWSGR